MPSHDPVHWRELSIQLRLQGKLAEAVDTCRRALDQAPGDALAWNELAHALRLQGQFSSAREAAQRALQLHPGLASAWFNLGAVLVAQNDVTQGVAAYRKALELQPEFAEVWSNLGGIFGSQGKSAEEIDAYRRALAVNPRLAPVWSNLGDALLEEGDLQEALSACQHAVELDPGFAAAWNNLGNVKFALGESVVALDAFRRALELDPRLMSAWSNLGIALLGQGAIEDAVAAHTRAAELAPDHALCLRNLAQALGAAKRFAEAVTALRRAVALAPDHAGLRAELVSQLLGTCDWGELAGHIAKLDAAGTDAVPHAQHEPPLANITRCDDPARNLVVAQRAARRISLRYRSSSPAQRRPESSDERVTVGYLSCDIHNHATAHLMRGVFKLHDHEHFRIHTYSYGPDYGSSYRAEIRAASDVFRDIRALSHRAAAGQIAADGVDILVDLKGWTEGIRFEICALRPAPLQMTYLGFPGTCGADFMDYAIVDAVVVPPDNARFYSEQLIYLPHCYQSNDDQQPIAADACRRSDHGLPPDAPVLCSFNRSNKLDPIMFATWMGILKRVPQAVLWLFVGNRWAEDNLRLVAQTHGVAPRRLIFAEGTSKPQHLRRLQLADVALDTRIYNGHTTTSDALWAGVPVVALIGRHFASRVSASCLGAIGMPELITRTLAEYEDLAVSLATDRAHRNAVKAKLAQNRAAQPLFDTSRFTRNLEGAYMQAWRHYLAGNPARAFEVEDNAESH